jgi:general secretion pathway protein L
VLLSRAPRVARSRRQLEQAVPYAIEEQLAAPVEQLHVALDPSAQGADLIVAVVAQAAMDDWLQALRSRGFEPDRMLPESLLLPSEPGATLWIDGRRAILRHAPGAAFSGRIDEVPQWLGLLESANQTPLPLRCLSAATALPPGLACEHEVVDAPLRWLGTRLGACRGPDLLQGRYAPRRGHAGASRMWRWAAGLAAAALLAGLGQLWLEARQLESRYEAQRAEMEQLLRSAVPGLTRVVDPRAQLAAEETRLGRSTGGGVLPLLARIAPSLSGSGRYTIDGLEFRGDTLELVIRGPDVATLDGLREMLAALSLQVELTGATPGTGGVEGRLRVRSGA